MNNIFDYIKTTREGSVVRTLHTHKIKTCEKNTCEPGCDKKREEYLVKFIFRKLT